MITGEHESTEIHEQLKSALLDLVYRSESDYPLEFVCWNKPAEESLDAQFVCEQLGLSADEAVEESDAHEFLEACCKIEDWFGDEERAMVNGYEELRDLLNQHVQNLKVFRFGEIEITVVLVGEDETGEVLGFQTMSVET